jgi:hypothetical protein
MESGSPDDPSDGSAQEGELIPELDGRLALIGHLLDVQGEPVAFLQRGWGPRGERLSFQGRVLP